MFWLVFLYSTTLISTLSGMEIVSAILVIAWLFDSLRTRSLSLPLGKPIAVFSLAVTVGIFLGDATLTQKWSDLSRLRFFLFFWASAHWLSRIETKRWIVAFSVPILILAAYSTLQHFFPIDWVRPEGKKIILFSDGQGHGPLVLGFFNHHLTFANIILLYAPLFLSYGFYRFPRFILFWPLGLWLSLLCLWTGSRSAWVAVPITVLVIAIGKAWRWKEPTVATLSSLVVLGILYATNAPIRERFSHVFEREHTHQSVTPRLKLWRAQWEFFKEHPYFGVGWNNNERHSQERVDRLYPGESNPAGHAHSLPLQILSTTGALGFASFVWIWFVLFQTLWKSLRAEFANREQRWLALGLVAAFVGFWIQGFTQWNFGDAEVLHNVMFLWGLAISQRPSQRYGLPL